MLFRFPNFKLSNMKKAILISYIFIAFFSLKSNAQIEIKEELQEIKIPTNSANNPCITPEEYLLLDKQCIENRIMLGLDKTTQKSYLNTTFIWPLKAASGFTDYGFHFIGAYVDQNTTAGAILDYNCETNTYDAHQGTDIAVWPFGFYKLDNNQVEVIAAAPGTIIQKADGNFDRNCASNSLTANSIIIQHADGSQALYWHMKKNSVTSKIVGQSVVAGEYLGVVGSSGNSSGPHLHFEVRSGSASTTYKDPFAGSCNSLNANSWWISQKPHTDPTILKVSVNTTDIPTPSCPTTEITNESNSYTIPFQGAGLSAGYAKFYIFLREIPASSGIDMQILNPNGTVFNSWMGTISTFYKTSYWGYSKKLPTNSGTYTFQATYNGVTCSKKFDIINPLSIDYNTETDGFQIYPNPINNDFYISTKNIKNGNYTLKLISITGQVIENENIKIENNIIQKSFFFPQLSKGIYFLDIEGEDTKMIKKIIKN